MVFFFPPPFFFTCELRGGEFVEVEWSNRHKGSVGRATLSRLFRLVRPAHPAARAPGRPRPSSRTAQGPVFSHVHSAQAARRARTPPLVCERASPAPDSIAKNAPPPSLHAQTHTAMATAADYGLDAGTSATAPAPSLREDMVQNAVAFLTHAKVATSPDASKREFLEKKGLTGAEIDEAFRRAPVAPVVAAETALAPASTLPPPPKPYPVAPGTALACPPPPPPPRQPWTLTHVALGLAAATAAAAGAHSVVRPRVTAWLADRAAARAAAAAAERDATAKATAAAVADAVGGVLAGHAARIAAAADAVAAAAARLDKGKGPALVNGGVGAATAGITRAELQAELAALGDLLTAGGVVPAAAPPPPPPPQPLSQPALSTDAQRQIADLRAELAALRTARGAEPVGRWSAQGDSGVGGGAPPPPPPPPPAPSVAPPPVSYTAVLAMLERGETPPGVRTDIVDTPPAGVALPPPAPSGPPPPKPWDSGSGMAAAPALFGGGGDSTGVASHPLRASAFGSASVDGEPPATANGGAVPAPAPPSTTTGDDDVDASDVEPIVGVFGGGGVGATGFGWQPPAPPARSLPG